jgi:O-antigen/teichoic acid export membrane protein
MSVFQNGFFLLTFQAVNYLVPFILVPILIIRLGIEGYGVYAIASAVSHFFLICTDYGFQVTATKRIAANRHDGHFLGSYVGSIIAARVVLFMVCFLALVLLIPLIPLFQKNSDVLYTMSLVGLANTIHPTWLYHGFEKMFYILLFGVIGRLFFLVGVYVLVINESDLLLLCLLNVLSVLITSSFGIYYANKLILQKIQIPKYTSVINAFKEAKETFYATLSVSVYRVLPTAIVGTMYNEAAVGLFAISEKIVRIITSAVHPVSQAIFPRTSRAFKISRENGFKFAFGNIRFFLIIGCCLTVALFLFANDAIYFLTGGYSGEAIQLIYIMAPLPLVTSLGNSLGMHVLLHVGGEQIYSKIFVSSGLLSILFFYVALKNVGIEGVALGIVMSEFIATLLLAVAVLKVFKNKQKLRMKCG